jgi:hypothetical protein
MKKQKYPIGQLLIYREPGIRYHLGIIFKFDEERKIYTSTWPSLPRSDDLEHDECLLERWVTEYENWLKCAK